MIRRWLPAAVAACLLVCGCTVTPRRDGALNVVVSTEIIADLVRRVGGDRVTVDTVVPPGGDPHSYNPAPADVAKVASADVAFTNHLLLEEHGVIKLFDSNMPKGRPHVSLAENAERYGATLIPLVEDVGLDVIWLGLAVRGEGPSRSADVRLTATKLDGPGRFVLYLVDALGQPKVYYNSTDGLDTTDVAVLPPNAHTHLNWAFTDPGIYTLTLAATLDPGGGEGSALPLGEGTFTFAVGVDPATAAPGPGITVLDDGHTDLAVDLDTRQVFARTFERGDLPAPQVVIEVPNKAVDLVPDDRRFAFLGSPGSRIWQLPQAVLGKHVHGEIDPHLWEDVRNAKAYVQIITDTLISADAAGRAEYEARRDAYLVELEELHRYVGAQIAQIPQGNRKLVTTHDAFGYLAKAYGMEIAGFVVPNPAQEPSAAQVAKLTETVTNLKVRAVFLEPNLHHRASVLRRVAEDHGVATCVIYGDAFDKNVTTYVAMMRHNADELLRCLGEGR